MNNYLTSIGLLIGAIALSTGCASKENYPEPYKPGSGIAEFRQITEASTQAIENALSSLAAAAAQSNQVSPDALAAFSDAVQRLQVESIQVRARAQAILQRGDAYFERWHETLAKVKDPEVRALAEKNRPLLQQSFQKIKTAAPEIRAVFKPFLAGLRGLRNSLEKNPASLTAGASQELLATTQNQGKQLLEQISSIRNELDTMKSLLTPPGR